MKFAMTWICALLLAAFAFEAVAGGPQRWICLGDSITRQPGFADAVCAEKIGIDGATSGSWRNEFLAELPFGDHAVVMLGTNDAHFHVPAELYADNMLAVVERLREQYRRIILVVAPKTSNLADSVFLAAYRTQLLAICKAQKRVRCAEPVLVPSLHLEPGSVHPNSAGHSLIALEVNRAQRGKK